MSKSKHYSTEVSCANEFDESPSTALFVIDEEDAKEIVRLARLVIDNELYRVERADYRVSYFMELLEEADEDDEPVSLEETFKRFFDENGEGLRTDGDCISVGSGEFWFSASAKHSSSEYVTAHQPIQELADHFGIEFRAPAQAAQ